MNFVRNDQLGFQAGSPQPGSRAGSLSCTLSTSTFGKFVLHLSQRWTVLGAPVWSGRPTPMACISMLLPSWRFPFRLWLFLLNRNHFVLHFMNWSCVPQPCWTSPLAPEAASWVLPDSLCGQWYCLWVKVMALHGLGIPIFFWVSQTVASTGRIEGKSWRPSFPYISCGVQWPFPTPYLAQPCWTFLLLLHLFVWWRACPCYGTCVDGGQRTTLSHLSPSRGSQGLTSGHQTC